MWSKVICGHPKWPPAAILRKKSNLRIDLKWREMRSKVIFGHPKWPLAAILWKKIKVAYWSEMVRNAIESDFRSSKMAQIGLPKWPPAAILKNKSKKKLRIDLKWREMHSKVIFGHPKWPPAAIMRKKIKVAYWSVMARNAIKSDFRSSKMAAGSHFVKKCCVLIWNDEKCDRKWFSIIQNGRRQPFYEQNKKFSIDLKWREMRLVLQKWPPAAILWKKKSKLRIALKWREVRSKLIFGHPKWWPSQWPACKPFGDIHSICPWANTAILVWCLDFVAWFSTEKYILVEYSTLGILNKSWKVWW